MSETRPTTTRGIQSAQNGPLAVLQHETGRGEHVFEAAMELARYHPPKGDQQSRHEAVAVALASFLETIVANCPPGPERSTAVSRAREAKFWASAAIAQEG